MNLKFKILAVVLLFITLQACQESDDSIYSKNETIESIDAYRIALSQDKPYEYFNNLLPDQKSLVWQGKFENYLQNNSLNTDQRLFVEKLKSKMTIELFSYSCTDCYQNLFIEATKIFDANHVILLFYKLENDLPKNTAEERRMFGQEFTPNPGASCEWIEVSPNVFEYGIQGTYTSYAFWIETNEQDGWYPCDFLGGE